MNNILELFSTTEDSVCRSDDPGDKELHEYKFQHEIHRMMGILRFSPDDNGVFTAKCAPDYYILPNLIEYFTARFGETPWSIIDEKRGFRLCRLPGEEAKITSYSNNAPTVEKEKGNDANTQKSDEWEELWKHYHKTINNEDRSNPELQRQFMPKRYWKYLPEV